MMAMVFNNDDNWFVYLFSWLDNVLNSYIYVDLFLLIQFSLLFILNFEKFACEKKFELKYVVIILIKPLADDISTVTCQLQINCIAYLFWLLINKQCLY